MQTLSSAERRALRAKAHHLHPVVSIGQHGLTPSVLHEIDVNLIAHELIKIRVFSDARGDRDAMLERICGELGAAPVQHVGKLLIVWRPAPKEAQENVPPSRRRDTPAEKSAARKAPQARRPRTPLPRAPARPLPRSKTPIDPPTTPTSRRRRAMTNAASTWEDTDERLRRRSKSTSAARGAEAPRSNRPAGTKGSFKAAARPAATPHGKSSSSKVGAAGARRRRRKAG